jgi:hypothetical protein
LFGKIGSGKDTVFAEIKKQEPKAENLKFANKTYEIASASLGLTVEAVHTLKRDENFYFTPPYQSVWVDSLGHSELVRPFNIREYLRNISEGVKEKISPDFFVNLVLPLGFKHDTRICVVTDMRFQNELERVRLHGGYVVHVRRDSIDEVKEEQSNRIIDSHAWDYEINNDGTRAALKTAVEALLADIQQIGGPKGGTKTLLLSEEQKHVEIPEEAIKGILH